MRSLLLVVALAVAAAPGCGSHDATTAVTPGMAAGDVTEVAGVVHATRAGAIRTLARGDVVSGDDVITTGADGRVTIVLRHNHVPWSLGPSRTKRVSESAAWSASAAAGAAEVADDHSAAAGRHAERSATDTAATTAAPPMQPAEATPTTGSGSAAGSAAGSGASGGGGSGEGTIEIGRFSTLGHGGGGGGGAGGGRLGGSRATPRSRITLAVDVTGDVPEEVATQIVRRNLSAFRFCYENQLREDPAAAGKVTLAVIVTPTGAVGSSSVAVSTVADPVGECLVRRARTLSFPPERGMTRLQVTFTLAPGS